MTLSRLEEQLVLADRILRMTQPPISGKFGVQWWKMHGGEAMKTPVLVRWRRLRNGRWRGYEVKQLHQSMLLKNGSAKLCREETWRTLQAVKLMIPAYWKAAKVFRSALRRLDRVNEKAQRAMWDAGSELLAAHHFAEQKLLDAGYDIVGNTRQLVADALLPE